MFFFNLLVLSQEARPHFEGFDAVTKGYDEKFNKLCSSILNLYEKKMFCVKF